MTSIGRGSDMSVYTNPPEWEAQGKKPPSSKRTEGWKPGDRVPASWLNWFWFSTVNSLREIAQAFIEHRDAAQNAHGVGEIYVAKTSRSDQIVGWSDIKDTPSEYPPSPHTHDDRYYTRDQVDQIASSSIPRGVIVAWSGSIDSIPAGWALCDGTNGT